MRTRIALTLALIFSCSAASSPSFAQSISDVSSPDVEARKGHVSWRTGYRPEGDGFKEALAHRLHVQWAANGAVHWRAGALFSQSGSAPLKFSSAFGEVNWQTHEHEEAGFDSSLRFDLQLADLSRSRNRARVMWLAQSEIGDGWQARANLGLAKQFGKRASEDAIGSLSLMLSRVVTGKQRLGLEASTDSQSDFVQTGLVASGPITGPWSYQAAVNAGVSDNSPPVEFRFFLNRGF